MGLTLAMAVSTFIVIQRALTTAYGMRLFIWLWTFSLGISSWSSLGSELSSLEETGTGGPIWRVDLGVLGFGPLKWHRDEMIGMPTGVAPICFRSREDLVVTFVTREAPGSLPRRERPDEPLPYRLHALFVNVKSGRLRATREWPTASEKAGVMPATEGNFVMLTPDKLTLYSSELRPIGNLDIFLTHRAHEDWWHVQRSPNGRSILIDYAEDSRYYGFQWVSLDDLRGS